MLPLVFGSESFIFLPSLGEVQWWALVFSQNLGTISVCNAVCIASVAQLVERSLGKTEVSGPIPDGGSLLNYVCLTFCQVTQVANEGSL